MLSDVSITSWLDRTDRPVDRMAIACGRRLFRGKNRFLNASNDGGQNMIEKTVRQHKQSKQRDGTVQNRPYTICPLLWSKRELVAYYQAADKRHLPGQSIMAGSSQTTGSTTDTQL